MTEYSVSNRWQITISNIFLFIWEKILSGNQHVLIRHKSVPNVALYIVMRYQKTIINDIALI